jgi:TolB-like protein
VLLWIASALASTVAVLPLDKAAGSEAYDGLGKGLAGLIVSDLSAVDGLVVVERDRLDAVLDEIALGATSFVDPKTARKAGQGVGAEWVVVGEYSVVADTFVMSARVVVVETGEVRTASDASGTVAKWVDVEKQVVTDLLDQLDAPEAERREALDLPRPRELGAVQSYGLGLARQDDGKLEEARAAFREAVRMDPEFGLARSALGQLRQRVEAETAERQRQKDAARAAKLDRVLAEVPGPRQLASKKKWSGDDVVGFGLRWLVLEMREAPCQRYDEMSAYLERVGWKPKYPLGSYEATWKAITRLGVKYGLAPTDDADPGGHRDFEFQVQTGPAGLFHDTARFLYPFPGSDLDVRTAEDPLHAMAACVEPDEVDGELVRIRDAVLAAGVGDLVVDREWPDLGLAERIDVTRAVWKARTFGVDDALNESWNAMLDRHLAHDRTHGFLLQKGREIAQWGEIHERRRAQSVGRTAGEIDRVLEAFATDDATVLVLDTPLCSAAIGGRRPWVAGTLERKHADPATWDPIDAWSGTVVGPLGDLGCIRGTPARFADTGAAWAHVIAARSRERPEHAKSEACVQAFRELPKKTTQRPADRPYETGETMDLLAWYYGSLVFPLCVDP